MISQLFEMEQTIFRSSKKQEHYLEINLVHIIMEIAAARSDRVPPRSNRLTA